MHDRSRVTLDEDGLDVRPLSFWRGIAYALPVSLVGWFIVAPTLYLLTSCVFGALK